MYESLKGICNYIIVITGAVGGRGVAYHDIKHERILTDMYTCWDCLESRQITADGQAMIQNLGRLNTIFVDSNFPRGGCPPITLWAPRAIHEIHKIHLANVYEDSTKVKDAGGDLERALKTSSNYVTGCNAAGKKHFLPSSSAKFRKREQEVKQGPDIVPELGPRVKQPRIEPPADGYGALSFPAGGAAAGTAPAAAAGTGADPVNLTEDDASSGGAAPEQWRDDMDDGRDGTFVPDM